MADIKKVQRAKKGNHKVFQELMEEEKIKLYKMAYIYMKNEDDALEVFQETVCKAFTSIKNLKDERYFSTWLTRILINTAIDLLKRKKRVIPMEREILESKMTLYQSSEKDPDLLEAVLELDEKYKTVLVLRFYKDYTVKQIAEFLDCPQGTVKTNIHRGINLLKGKLKEDCVNEQPMARFKKGNG
ncbi:sigma-70 family RNA polymerase sigma factor [Cytobacillus depressus]|uniref:Sigma-70 family RNA polymerase sigma factor n=1 Tax=Cytobacillus depressus TaxID=1602942 RepID=A0A6L3V6H6_9BACI|nr:sigma-70 family RNA polymerase sigma factor [Cytobacillus depressus]KAB2334883.1 sigma-70 family RNA polymerase sigma factor [Cytobacillus depressus]